MTIRYLENNNWVVVKNLSEIYNQFIQQPLPSRFIPRTTPITLEDGTVIDQLASIKGLLTIAVQAYLDAGAQTKGYDNIFTASLRASYTGPYQAEGVIFATWMDEVWAAANTAINAITIETITTAPSIEVLISSLPITPTFS